MSDGRNVHARSSIAGLLRRVLSRSPCKGSGAPAALYVAGLRDPAGFALVLRLHERTQGPDPAILRERAQLQQNPAPRVIGATSVDVLADVLASLGADARTGAENAALLREVSASGLVPVLVVDCGDAAVTTLDAIALLEAAASVGASVDPFGGWTTPVIGKG